MKCTSIRLPDGSTAILCGPKRYPVCQTPGCGQLAPRLCDYPVRDGKTCDRRMCAGHATSVGEDKDYCPAHARMAEQAKLL